MNTAVLTRESEAPTPIRPGRWRCLYRALPPYVWEPDSGRGDIVPGFALWPSREIADEKGPRNVEEAARRGRWPDGSVVYAGAEFVPGAA